MWSGARGDLLGAMVAALTVAGCSFDGASPTSDARAADSALPDPDAAVDAPNIERACHDNSDYELLPGGSPGDSTFKFVSSGKNFSTAEVDCRITDESQLARVLPDTATVLLGELLSRDLQTGDCTVGGGDNDPCAWVGVLQAAGQGDPGDGWQLVSGEPIAGDDPRWRTNEPDDGGGGETDLENCAALSIADPGGLEDRECGLSLPAICECKPPNEV
jgi:hypothetical protein